MGEVINNKKISYKDEFPQKVFHRTFDIANLKRSRHIIMKF